MAAITTQQAGPWATGSTWVGGSKPGNGDTATINHAVTIATSEIVGNSPAAGNIVLTINAALTIQNGGTLRLRGDAVVADVAFTRQKGGSLIFDASLASSPSTTSYRCTIGTADNQTNNYFISDGVDNSDTGGVSSDAGGANGYFIGGTLWAGGGKAKCSYTNFTRIGDGSNYAFFPNLQGSSSDTFYCDYCIFDSGAGVGDGGVDHHTGATYRLLHTTFKNTTGLTPRIGVQGAVPFTSGQRSVTFCVFDTRLQMYGPQGFTYEDNYFHLIPDLTDGVWASFQRNFVRTTDTIDSFTPAGSIKDNYHLHDADSSNPHFLTMSNVNQDLTIDGGIYELMGTVSAGDCNSVGLPTAPVLIRLINLIILPGTASSPRNQSGTVVSALGNSNVSFLVDHCTAYVASAASGVAIGETYTGYAGMCRYARNSIFWSDDATLAGMKMANQDTFPGVTDLVSGTNADFNCGYQIGLGRMGHGYDMSMTVIPGAHDVDVNPQFVDAARGIRSWDTSLGGAGTSTNAITELRKINDRAGYNSNYSISALIAYVRAGYLPQNDALRRAASDNTTIGAVQMTPPTVASTPRKRLAVTQRV